MGMVNKYKIIYKKGGNNELFDKIKEKLQISSIEIMTQEGEIPIKVKYKYDNGYIYEGFVDEEYKPNGEGKMTFQEKEEDGWVYKGEVNENYTFNGQGTIRYLYGNYYQGKWLNNKLIDNVKVKFIDGDLFEGNVGENLDYNSEGYLYLKNPVKGKITYVNEDIYEGFFKDQFIKDGKGTMFFKNEDTFEGTFENDIAKNGKYKFKNGKEHNDDNGEIYKNKIFLNNIDYDNLDKEKENIKRILNIDMFKEQSTKILLEILNREIEKKITEEKIFIDFDKKIIN